MMVTMMYANFKPKLGGKVGAIPGFQALRFGFGLCLRLGLGISAGLEGRCKFCSDGI